MVVEHPSFKISAPGPYHDGLFNLFSYTNGHE